MHYPIIFFMPIFGKRKKVPDPELSHLSEDDARLAISLMSGTGYFSEKGLKIAIEAEEKLRKEFGVTGSPEKNG